MSFIILSILTILSISTVVNAGVSYSTSVRAIQDKIIHLDSTDKKSYTHYLAKEYGIKNYTFSIQMSQDFPGIFIDVTQYRVPGDQIIKSKSTFHSVTQICEVYQMKFTYPDGVSKLLCNGTKRMTSLVAGAPGVIVDYSGQSGLIVVNVFILSNYQYDYSGLGYNSLDGPLVGPTGRKIPKSTIGSMTFTAYRDCHESTKLTEIPLVLRSCSNYNKSKCITSDLFCDGDINCGFSLMDFILDVNVDYQGYDESDRRCANNRNWEQKPEKRYEYISNSNSYLNTNSNYGYTSYSQNYSSTSFHKGFIIIPVGLIVLVIGIVVRFASRKKTNTNARIGKIGNIQQGLLREV